MSDYWPILNNLKHNFKSILKLQSYGPVHWYGSQLPHCNKDDPFYLVKFGIKISSYFTIFLKLSKIANFNKFGS